MAKILVQLTGLFFMGYGIGFALFPVEMANYITGASPSTASGLMDLRATYGGMTAGVGLVLLLLAAQKEHLAFALLTIAIILLFMAISRAFGMVIDGPANGFMYGYLVAEIIGATISLGLRHSMVEKPQ